MDLVTEPASRTCRVLPLAAIVLIGRNSRGQWVVRENNGLFGGLFVDREAALRYATAGNGRRGGAMIWPVSELELAFAASPPRQTAMPARRAA
ncbi:hypothetical protein [Rhodopseudomonas palustris]|uniref:Uncharacterized protein n=1 Tax=Rhodopseudomonas palustris (strain BisB18) TaxID=316056 RepID=Q216I6_RHOPB